MKILIISPGKKNSPEIKDAISEYETRLKPTQPVEWVFPEASTKELEEKAILKLLDPGDLVILLDEQGKDISSPGLAALLDTSLQQSVKRMVFVIGGAFGVTEAIHARANHVFKLSSLVFPHMLVRLILIEQLYRATSIRAGGKYHHA